jgi:hypothetical protein
MPSRTGNKRNTAAAFFESTFTGDSQLRLKRRRVPDLEQQRGKFFGTVSGALRFVIFRDWVNGPLRMHNTCNVI